MDHGKSGQEVEDVRAKLMCDILNASKEGNTKAELEKILGLSHQEVREITAELTDKGFLRQVAAESRRYITTEDGYKFLNASQLSDSSRESTLSNKEINDVLEQSQEE